MSWNVRLLQCQGVLDRVRWGGGGRRMRFDDCPSCVNGKLRVCLRLRSARGPGSAAHCSTITCAAPSNRLWRRFSGSSPPPVTGWAVTLVEKPPHVSEEYVAVMKLAGELAGTRDTLPPLEFAHHLWRRGG